MNGSQILQSSNKMIPTTLQSLPPTQTAGQKKKHDVSGAPVEKKSKNLASNIAGANKIGLSSSSQLLNANNLPKFIIQRQMGISTVKDSAVPGLLSNIRIHSATMIKTVKGNRYIQPNHKLNDPELSFLHLTNYNRENNQLIFTDNSLQPHSNTKVSLWKKREDVWKKEWQLSSPDFIKVVSDSNLIRYTPIDYSIESPLGNLIYCQYDQTGIQNISSHIVEADRNSCMNSWVIYTPENDPPFHICTHTLFLNERYGRFWKIEHKKDSHGGTVVDIKSLPFPSPDDNIPHPYLLKIMLREDNSLLCYKSQPNQRRDFFGGRFTATSLPGNLHRMVLTGNEVTWHRELESSKILYPVCDPKGSLEGLVTEGEDDKYIVKIWSSEQNAWLNMTSYKFAKYIDIKRLQKNTYIIQAYHQRGTLSQAVPTTPTVCQQVSTKCFYTSLDNTDPAPLIMSCCLQLRDGRIVTSEDLHNNAIQCDTLLKIWTQHRGQWLSETIAKCSDHIQYYCYPSLVHEIEPGTIALPLQKQREVHIYDLYNPQPQKEREP